MTIEKLFQRDIGVVVHGDYFSKRATQEAEIEAYKAMLGHDYGKSISTAEQKVVDVEEKIRTILLRQGIDPAQYGLVEKIEEAAHQRVAQQHEEIWPTRCLTAAYGGMAGFGVGISGYVYSLLPWVTERLNGMACVSLGMLGGAILGHILGTPIDIFARKKENATVPAFTRGADIGLAAGSALAVIIAGQGVSVDQVYGIPLTFTMFGGVVGGMMGMQKVSDSPFF
ncbi:hypothetical protein HYS47_00975 [Candidatus Woesearchaeota archaeon]|nr:hypothetical protein [Candidatus Woesearchaeota archaeon]